jgi:hypothetical protein
MMDSCPHIAVEWATLMCAFWACEEYPLRNEINTDLKIVTWGSSEVGEPSFIALITVLVVARQGEKSDITYPRSCQKHAVQGSQAIYGN